MIIQTFLPLQLCPGFVMHAKLESVHLFVWVPTLILIHYVSVASSIIMIVGMWALSFHWWSVQTNYTWKVSRCCCCHCCVVIIIIIVIVVVLFRWVHVVCILYTPNIEYVEPNRLSGVTLDQLSTSRWGNKVCQLCFDAHMNRTGVCIGCDAGLCKSSFHVTWYIYILLLYFLAHFMCSI